MQLIDEIVGEFYVRLATGSLSGIVGIFVGVLQFLSGEETVRFVYTIVTGNVKEGNYSSGSSTDCDPSN